MKKFVTYAVMLAYLTVTVHPVQAQQYEDDTEAAPQYQPQPAPQPQYQQSVTATSQLSGKPKVAVYVSEERRMGSSSRAAKSAMKSATVNALVNSGRFNVVERSNIIEEELKKQTSGDVDDDQLTAFGRQLGAQLVCVSDMIRLGETGNQVSVRLIDVETAEILAFGLNTVHISGGEDMTKAISAVVDKMLTTIQPRASASMPKMAVYLADESSEESASSALYSYTLEALFARSRILGNFRVVERSNAFTKQIGKEHKTQQSGHIDDNQIARMGKQYGIGKILIAGIERFNRHDYNISARIVDIETASLEKAAGPYTINSSLFNLGTISARMVEEVMGLTKAEEDKRTAMIAKEKKSGIIRNITYVVVIAALAGILFLTKPNKKTDN